jgi:hypothetical protein
MPVWPKSVYSLGLSLKTAATEFKLRQRRSARAQQEGAFAQLRSPLARTKVWSAAGLERGMSYAQFRSRVAPSGYAQLLPSIERMMRGEADVLWPGRCPLFVATPGTSGQGTKRLPVTEELLVHFRRAALDSLLYYTVRVKHAGVFRGRHLLLGSSTAPSALAGSTANGGYSVELAGLAALSLPRWAEKHLYEPGVSVGQIPEWQMRVNAIVARTSRTDISLLAGLPAWSLVLAQALRQRNGAGAPPLKHLQQAWPNLECFVHTGTPIAPFYHELRELLGPSVTFHEVYFASEGFVAAQDGESSAGLRLMADLGIFFEFLPQSDFDETRLEQLGARLVPLADVKAGVNYAVFLTTPGGLVRYSLGDVVRFASVEPPRLFYCGRTHLGLRAFGENVVEKEITDALVTVCQRHKWSIVNFHVAPIFATDLTGQTRGRHEWWVELIAGTVATPTGPHLAAQLDAELLRLNPDYGDRRKSGVLAAPYVRLVMPGVFEHWLRYHGRWGGVFKMPRCRSDRLVADELAQVTQFARD